jgi:hypothetical protein
MNYDLSVVQSELLSLVKFKRDFDTDYLDSELIGTSISGRYFNSGVPSILTLKNIYSFMPIVTDWSISAYAGATTYAIDQIVSSTAGSVTTYYISLADSNTGKALSNASYWKATTLQSVWLKRKIYDAIEQVLSKSIQTDVLIDHELLYSISDISDTVANEHHYVGFEIRANNSEHLKVIINQVGAQFTSVNTDVPIYLYNQNTLIATGSFDNVANEFSWNTLTSFEVTGQGKWYIFYNQDDITGEATNWNFYSANQFSKFVEVLPFEVVNTTTNFVKDVCAYTQDSYGLGLNLSVKADLTNFIKQNKFAFAECIQMQFAYNMLELFLVNAEMRSNTIEKRTTNIDKDLLLAELKSESKHSFISNLDRAYKNLIKSLNFGDVCLPDKTGGSFIINTNFG